MSISAISVYYLLEIYSLYYHLVIIRLISVLNWTGTELVNWTELGRICIKENYVLHIFIIDNIEDYPVSANLKLVLFEPKHVHIGHVLVQTTPKMG